MGFTASIYFPEWFCLVLNIVNLIRVHTSWHYAITLWCVLCNISFPAISLAWIVLQLLMMRYTVFIIIMNDHFYMLTWVARFPTICSLHLSVVCTISLKTKMVQILLYTLSQSSCSCLLCQPFQNFYVRKPCHKICSKFSNYLGRHAAVAAAPMNVI
jgi:hypothetical protein